jgi:hypothetical protein
VALYYRKQRPSASLRQAQNRWTSLNGETSDWIDAKADVPPDVLQSKELAILVRQALSNLPAEYQSLLLAKYVDNRPVGSIDGTTIAWARVMEAIENSHTITSRETRTLMCEGKELPFLGTSQVMKYASSEYGVREDMLKEGETLSHTYWLLKDNECVEIIPSLKQCTHKPLTETEKRVLHQMNPEGVANMIRSSDSVELGRKTIDAVEVEGLEIRGDDLVVAPVKLDDVVIRMWVDVETHLPVVIEAEAVTTDKAITTFTDGKPVHVQLLAGEFQWDVELAPEIFEPNVPDDYTILGQ